MENITIDFQDSGNCEIDVPKVVDQWNENCLISQWKDEYRLIEGIPDTEDTNIKLTISKAQAHELIVELDLVNERSPIFNSGSSWRKKEQE